MDAKRFVDLCEKVDRLRREADRAQGALGQLETRLRDEWGCDDLKAAEKKLAELDIKAPAAAPNAS